MNAIACVKRFYDALARADAQKALEALHQDLQWTEAEGFLYHSGTWHSPAEVGEKLLSALARDWRDFKAEPLEFLAQGDVVVCFGQYSGTYIVTGKSMRAAFVHRWEVCGGKIARFDMHADTLLIDRATRP